MIVILSRQDDGSTAFIIEWLMAMKKKYIRLNSDTDRMKFISFDIDNRELIIEQNGIRTNLCEATSLWYRRIGISLKNTFINETLLSQPVFLDEPQYHKFHVKSEMKTLVQFIHSFIECNCTSTIGSLSSADVNKLQVLEIARKHGLDIPKSYIVTSKKDLIKIITLNDNSLVTKAIGQGVYFFTKNFHYYSYTEKLTLDNVKSMPDFFFPSFVQVEIKKKFELRIFYLKGEFYSMAIFSQKNKKTTVDCRKSTPDRPNRLVPYSLPMLVKEKLRKLLDELHLDTGSIDIIVDKDNNYIFLEVNPIGQFSMTSIPCNYYLEKKIAEIL